MVVDQLKAHLLVQLELNIKLRPTLSAPSGAIMNYSVVFTINTHHCTTNVMVLELFIDALLTNRPLSPSPIQLSQRDAIDYRDMSLYRPVSRKSRTRILKKAVSCLIAPSVILSF